MTLRRERALEQRITYHQIAMLALVTVIFALFFSFQQYRYVTVIAGAEDDCMLYYGAYKLYDVYGIEIDGHHAVECRYN